MTWIFLATALGILSAQADTPTAWPGLWGPSRNAITRATLPNVVSRAEVVWRRPLRGGYSEVVIRGTTVFTLVLDNGEDFIVALDANSGEEKWRLRIGATYRGHGGSDDGPIATPSVEGNDLFALGPHGHLIAADATTGRERWRHDLRAQFGARPPTWGFAASPLVEGNLVIVPTAGPESRGLLAFHRDTGTLAWSRAVARTTSYSSAVAVTVEGVRQVMVASSDVVFAVTPQSGELLWQHSGPGGEIEVANSPILFAGDRVLVSNWEQSQLLQVTRVSGRFAAKELWRSTRLRSSNGPTIYRDGHLYGFAGAQLICLDATTGDVVWRERTGAGTVIAIDDKLIFLSQDTGELQVATLSTSGFAPMLRTRVLAADVRAVTGPSFAGNQLYLRNLHEIIALRFHGG